MRALLILLAACTFEQEHTAKYNLWVVGDTCPSPYDAAPILADIWGGGGTEINGSHCSWDEWIEIQEPEPDARVSCCYLTTCSAELDPASNARRHLATCLGRECALYDLTSFTRAKAAAQLAATGLPCELHVTPEPIEVPTTQCWYVASAIYITLFMRLLGHYPWAKSAAIGVAVSASIFVMFEVWFKVPLFKGAVDPLAFLGY